MQLTFRQGIVSYQLAPLFLTNVIGGFVSLNAAPTPTVVTFAHGTVDYLLTEKVNVPNAWTIAPIVDQWIYWDINTVTGVRTFGVTVYQPVVRSSAPLTPAVDQHWFDSINTVMNVWNGTAWITKIRVFAGKVNGGGGMPVSVGVNSPLYSGTQVGINNVQVVSGSILFDQDTLRPLRKVDGKFLTTETALSLQSGASAAVKLAGVVVPATADATLTAYTVVKFTDFGKINSANALTAGSIPVGMITTNVGIGQDTLVTVSGVVTNPNWNWPTVNVFVFSDSAGQLVTSPPVSTAVPVGVVIDVTSILLVGPVIAGEGTFVLLAGSTMTGLLILSGDPVVPLGAATKQYVDNALIAEDLDELTLSKIKVAIANNTICNAAWAQEWDWTLTADTTAFKFGECVAAPSTGGGISQYLVQIATLPTSTARPFCVTAQGSPTPNILVTAVGEVKLTGNDNAGGVGSTVTLLGGTGVSGGPISITGGASTFGAGGSINLTTGYGTNGNGGEIIITASGGDVGGGPIQLVTGNGAAGPGGSFSIFTGSGSLGFNGGAFSVTAGDGDTGGDATVKAGNGSTGQGGWAKLIAGDSATANAGQVQIVGGNGVTVGGDIQILGGFGSGGDGGTIYIFAGVGTPTGGNIIIATGNSNTERLRITATGEWQLAGDPGTLGYALTSNGPGTPPTWENIGGTYVDVAGDTMTGALLHPAGTAAAPSISFSGGLGFTDKGWYDSGVDEFSAAIAGAQKVKIDPSGITTYSGFIQGSPGGMALWNAADATTGISFAIPGQVDIVVGGFVVGTFGGIPGSTTVLVAGDIGTTVQAWDVDLDSIAGLGTAGIVVLDGTGGAFTRTITSTGGTITVTDGDGVAGNPDIDLTSIVQGVGTDFVKITLDGYGRVTGNTFVGASDINGALGYTAADDSTVVHTTDIGTTVQAWDMGLDELAALATNGNVRRTGGMFVVGAVDLTMDVTGTLPIANGGTGATTASGAITNLGAKAFLDTVVTKVFADSPYSVTATDEVVLADATAGAITVNLPTPTSGRRLNVKKIDSSANVVTVDTPGAETIDGAATFPLASQYDSVTLVSDGTDWFVL